jgi:aminoglycoside 3-N-acetyltransferase I
MRITRLNPGQEAEILAAPELFDEPPDREAVRAYLEDERNIFLLASEGSKATGFLRGTDLGQLKSTRRQMFLYEIGVDPESRRHGVAGELIRWLLNYCRERGFEEVFVMTDPANEAAVNLYRSTGAVTETPADRMFVYRL